MQTRFLLAWLALVASVLVACGGERAPATVEVAAAPAAAAATLSAPSTALADAARCQATDTPDAGPVQYRREGGQCWRSSNVLDAPVTAIGARKRALATAPTRLATAAELFDWAELNYANFFPTRETNRQLSSFTYRYYPVSRNHVAVSEGRVYVQGPISGGDLLFVGTVEDFTCRAVPALCGQAPADCAPPSQWTASSGQVCVPNPGQSARLAHGARFSYVDTLGAATGIAQYQCNNGTLDAVGTPTCDVPPPAACNTTGLTWQVAGNQCSPNATDPLQVAAGATFTFTDSVQTTGQATYRCDNGTLVAQGTPTCNPPPVLSCRPTLVEWNTPNGACRADALPAEVADGALYNFIDSTPDLVGNRVFRCNAGTLEPAGEAACQLAPTTDSFGGDGGAADGSASGDGTAADGAPITGAAVLVIDSTGRTASGTTDSRGYFRVKLTNMVPPMVIRVAKGTLVRHGINLQTPRTNAYIFMAVTGLTDKLVSDLAAAAVGDDGQPGAAALTPGQLVAMGQSVIDNRIAALRNFDPVRIEMLNAGLNPDTFNFLSTPFRADSTGYDAVLDNLIVTIENGATVLRTKTCRIRELSWTVGNNTCNFGSSTSTQLNIAAGSTLPFRDNAGSTRGTANFTCTAGVMVVSSTATCDQQP